jgi:TolB-like protein/Tfp pilus assembly protein PilF
MGVRRLTAIMFTDIVSYDSLLKENEKNAFDIRKKNQQIHRQLIRKFKGQKLKEMGSGILASFQSNIDAVMCAVSVQKATENLGIPLRIGIHQGDVIFEKKDVLGDGVNIASRIQGVIDRNGIVISETVYNDIKNKEGLDVESLGERLLKGVQKPLEIYSVNCQDENLLDNPIDTGELVHPFHFGRKAIVVGILTIALIAYIIYYLMPKNPPVTEPEKSILVLPPENYTGTDTLDYLVASVHDALITSIGRISALRVISRTSARAYYDPQKSLHEMASDAGVDVVIKSGVLCSGDNICLNVQMVNPDDEGQPLMNQEYNENMSQILKLYNTITKRVSDEININLRPGEEKLLAEFRTVDPDAYDSYIKGKQYLDQINRQSLPLAIEHFNKAVETDPDWAPPYAGLAEAGQYGKQMGFESVNSSLPIIYKNLYRALELDPNSANSQYTKAVISVWTEYDWKMAEEAFSKSIELNPSDAMARMFYAHLLMILNRKEDALHHAEIATRLDPLRPFVLGLYGRVLKYAGDYQSILMISDKALSIDPNNFFARRMLTEAYEALGDYESWFHQWKIIQSYYDSTIIPDIEKVFLEQGYISAVKAYIDINEERYKEGGHINFRIQSQDYLRVKNYERAIDYYEIMYEIKDPNLPYIGTDAGLFPELKNYPRYIALLKKMNLPVD